MFFAPAGEKQARLRSNKTKYQSFHTAVGTLQHSKEHLAPTWTPNGDFCWIIHSEVSNTETVAYLQHRFASPPPLCIIYESVSFLFNGATWEENTHSHTHAHARTHTNTQTQIWSRWSLQCFLLAFHEKNTENAENFGGRFCCSQHIPG